MGRRFWDVEWQEKAQGGRDDYMSTAEVVKAIRISVQTLSAARHRGSLPGIKVGAR